MPEGVPATITQDFPWQPGDLETAEQWTASRRGTERALVDHTWQLPGEFVVAQGGRIVLAHLAQHCEDFPLTEVILGAIVAARASPLARAAPAHARSARLVPRVAVHSGS